MLFSNFWLSPLNGEIFTEQEGHFDITDYLISEDTIIIFKKYNGRHGIA